MQWNWQRNDWPEFGFDAEILIPLEACFLTEAGRIAGTAQHLSDSDRDNLRIEFLGEEALKSSLIEGEFLDRSSVQSSLQRNFGLAPLPPDKSRPREAGMAELLAHAWKTYDEPLTQEMLHDWHTKLMRGDGRGGPIGQYREGNDPMRIISGDPFDPEIHFEAPPTRKVQEEMTAFLDWFHATTPSSEAIPLSGLTRAGLAHLRFETIHPYADGNGRLGRVIAEKSLYQSAGRPLLLALSHTIEAKKKEYYAALATTRFSNDVDQWLNWFCKICLESLAESHRKIEFLVGKIRFFAKYATQLNPRQEKVLLRLFAAGPDGFEGGLSAGNFVSIAKTSPATARRDLGELVRLGALNRTGQRKGTRYHLPMDPT